MKIGEQISFIVINMKATSLYTLIADGRYRNTSLGRDSWKTLIGSEASLQFDCNKEGFNVMCGESHYSKARIGIATNNQNKCDSCDSRIGFGTGGQYDDSNTCGNEASISPDNGDKHIKAMGYILVYWNQEKNAESLFKSYNWIQKYSVINKKAYFENLKCNEHSKKTLIT